MNFSWKNYGLQPFQLIAVVFAVVASTFLMMYKKEIWDLLETCSVLPDPVQCSS